MTNYQQMISFAETGELPMDEQQETNALRELLQVAELKYWTTIDDWVFPIEDATSMVKWEEQTL
jgi:hypothetical protein